MIEMGGGRMPDDSSYEPSWASHPPVPTGWEAAAAAPVRYPTIVSHPPPQIWVHEADASGWHDGPATAPARIVALVLDRMIWFVAACASLAVFHQQLGVGPRGYFNWFDLFIDVNSFAHPAAFWILNLSFLVYLIVGDAFGGTIGKRLLRLRVARHGQNRRLGLLRSFVRVLVARTLSGIFIGAGYWTSLADDDRRTWHDRMSGAFVGRAGWDAPE